MAASYVQEIYQNKNKQYSRRSFSGIRHSRALLIISGGFPVLIGKKHTIFNWKHLFGINWS